MTEPRREHGKAVRTMYVDLGNGVAAGFAIYMETDGLTPARDALIVRLRADHVAFYTRTKRMAEKVAKVMETAA